MGKSPTPPPAPDYAAANKAAIDADIDTLPLRNAINAASTLGTSYTDPATGKTYDFSGLGSSDINHAQTMQQLNDAPAQAQALLDLQKNYGGQFAAENAAQARATDPLGFELRDKMAGGLIDGKNSSESLAAKGADVPLYEMYGAGNPGNPGTANYESYIRNNPDLLANWENNEKNNPGQTLASYGKQHYEASGKGEGRELPMDGYVAPTAASNGPDMKMLSGSPEFEQLSGIKLADTGAAQAGRASLEQGVFDELAQQGQMDPALTRAAQQAARARGAASGNLYGDGAGLEEALGVQLQQRELDASRRNNALSLLQSGQTTSDKANTLAQQQQDADAAKSGFNNATKQQSFQNQAAIVDQNNNAGQMAFNNAMQAIGQRNQTLQNTFSNQQQVQQTQLGARQQDMANQQSFLGLAPVSNQFGNLSAPGAAPFNPTSANYGATGTNPGAGNQGAEWAGQLYGAQTGQQAAAAGVKNANIGAGASIAGAAIIAI
jgi:hypothetical protein